MRQRRRGKSRRRIRNAGRHGNGSFVLIEAVGVTARLVLPSDGLLRPLGSRVRRPGSGVWA